MQQKLITLCAESTALAKKKANFSKWVRMTLIKEEEMIEELEGMEEEIRFLKEACYNWSQRYYNSIEKVAE